MKKILVPILLIAIISFTCGTQKKVPTDDKTLTIGTFNIAWLGDGVDDRFDRSASDYKLIAEVIQNCGADVLGIQEIENPGAVKALLKHLPDWSFYLGDDGWLQNVGVLFNSSVEVEEIGEYMPVAVKENRTRPGFLIKGKKGNFDWLMMVVHFKSTSRYDNTPEKKAMSYKLRGQQASVVNAWADSVLSLKGEEDIFIVGDFNDTPTRTKNPQLTEIIQNPNLIFLTENLKSCKYRAWYVIDHVVASPSAKARFIPGSQQVYDTFSALPKKQAEKVSDHCPVLCRFNITKPDND